MTKHVISVGNKKYPYSLEAVPKTKRVRVKCEAAKIDQEFLKEDIGGFLMDLPEMILEEMDFEERQDQTIRFRVSSTDKKKIMQNALKHGYSNISGYLREIGLN